jgi:hypothetical protein
MHLQYQPQPPPPPPQQQQQQQQMGPAGAYGPMHHSPEQPVPGMPPQMSMSKPGTITGIQVILWILLAISTIANLFSIMSMVEFFNPFSLIGLAIAVHSAIQSLASGVHIARGKRWAWIWSLISAILGLALSAVAIVFGIIYVDNGGWITLLVGTVLAGLYGTLLGLLCSKSARQWILMHRIQRGEVQVPGGMGGMAGGFPQGPAPSGAVEPQRPETRPGSATFAVIAVWLLAALCAWSIFNAIRVAIAMSAYTYSLFDAFFYGAGLPTGVILLIQATILICAVITAPLLTKGKAGGRIFGIVWSILAVLAYGLMLVFVILDYLDGYYDLPPLPGQMNPVVPAFGWGIGRVVLALVIVILMFVPGVRAWTPGKPATALIMVVPMGGPQAPQQPGPYGQPQQPYQQQPGYPQQQGYPSPQPPQQGQQQQPYGGY